jgi:hypothetical protein
MRQFVGTTPVVIVQTNGIKSRLVTFFDLYLYYLPYKLQVSASILGGSGTYLKGKKMKHHRSL